MNCNISLSYKGVNCPFGVLVERKTPTLGSADACCFSSELLYAIAR